MRITMKERIPSCFLSFECANTNFIPLMRVVAQKPLNNLSLAKIKVRSDPVASTMFHYITLNKDIKKRR